LVECKKEYGGLIFGISLDKFEEYFVINEEVKEEKECEDSMCPDCSCIDCECEEDIFDDEDDSYDSLIDDNHHNTSPAHLTNKELLAELSTRINMIPTLCGFSSLDLLSELRKRSDTKVIHTYGKDSDEQIFTVIVYK
jgi:hypothetical protein